MSPCTLSVPNAQEHDGIGKLISINTQTTGGKKWDYFLQSSLRPSKQLNAHCVNASDFEGSKFKTLPILIVLNIFPSSTSSTPERLLLLHPAGEWYHQKLFKSPLNYHKLVRKWAKLFFSFCFSSCLRFSMPARHERARQGEGGGRARGERGEKASSANFWPWFASQKNLTRIYNPFRASSAKTGGIFFLNNIAPETIKK